MYSDFLLPAEELAETPFASSKRVYIEKNFLHKWSLNYTTSFKDIMSENTCSYKS